MNRIIFSILSFFVFVFVFVLGANAQVVKTDADTAYYMTIDEANYDSLRNTF